LFLRPASDSAYWALFGEKLFSKLSVNYEGTGYGWMAEAL
jgi:ABC-type proline/glycine betaine transport system substrate-binding protein